jgi:hypothetical protein
VHVSIEDVSMLPNTPIVDNVLQESDRKRNLFISRRVLNSNFEM